MFELAFASSYTVRTIWAFSGIYHIYHNVLIVCESQFPAHKHAKA